MCDCCNAEGRDYKKRCGPGARTRTARLYRVYVGRVASINLCQLCDLELFRSGESRFLANNIRFSKTLVTSQGSDSSFFD